MTTRATVVGVGLLVDAFAIAVCLTGRTPTGASRTDLVSTTRVPTGATVARVGLLVDTHATTTTLSTGTIAMRAAGTGAVGTRFA